MSKNDKRKNIRRISLFTGLASGFIISANIGALAYPQFQDFAEKKSGNSVNCAMCHSNANGPAGSGHGQIDGLNEEELKKLDEARKAFKPGQVVDSPILNEFGNKIIEKLGREEVLKTVSEPEKLATALGKEMDTDKDGIPDSEEYLDGTDPTNKFHGNPWKLFMINFNNSKQHILLAFLAIMCLNWGLGHLIKGIAVLTEKDS